MVEFGGVVVAAFLTIAAIYKAAPGVWGFVKAAARVPLTIDAILHEFSPNEGGSMRDAIDRLEERTGRIEERLTAVEER